ncbi:MarR family winged helix-turn-helix transcriptional regulator [Clostridium sp. UBA1056]|uniref:MarR family winged helix-turn-helix transcriptional regulator n=1 Tax=unclassified Clostridium TaxID=2614128 RepID=UPI0032163C3F
MDSELQSLDLIDLISERHILLRRICQDSWNNNNDTYISNSEWYIMARIYKKKPTLSYVTKHVDISRQATHKFVKNLESKGLIEITNSTNNNKDKCLQLTPLGEECYEINLSQKAALEQKVTEEIGADKVKILKDILKLDWGV